MSFAHARLAPELNSATAVAFLTEIVAAFYGQHGWALQRVLTDRGSEYKGLFSQACQTLRIHLRRIRP